MNGQHAHMISPVVERMSSPIVAIRESHGSPLCCARGREGRSGFGWHCGIDLEPSLVGSASRLKGRVQLTFSVLAPERMTELHYFGQIIWSRAKRYEELTSITQVVVVCRPILWTPVERTES